MRSVRKMSQIYSVLSIYQQIEFISNLTWGNIASKMVKKYDWTFQNERSNGWKVVAESPYGRTFCKILNRGDKPVFMLYELLKSLIHQVCFFRFSWYRYVQKMFVYHFKVSCLFPFTFLSLLFFHVIVLLFHFYSIFECLMFTIFFLFAFFLQILRLLHFLTFFVCLV